MTTTSLDPASTAQQLATAYTQTAQKLLKQRTQDATTTSTALTKLRSAMTAFDGAIGALSAKKSVIKLAATLGTSGYGNASASATAQPGTYSFFVEQLASAHQLAFDAMPTVAESGTLKLSQDDGTSFNVALGGADVDGSGTLSPAELARAINNASQNQGAISAGVVTVGGQPQLLLTAGKTGGGGTIRLDTSQLTSGALQTALSSPQTLADGLDAVVWLGHETTGVQIQQPGNTFTAIDGVSVTFTKAMASGDPPVTLTVANDSAGTAANVKGFVDAYNTLRNVLVEQTRAGANGATPGAFASDASIRSLRDRLANILRQDVGGLKLSNFGITADKTGTLTLDSAKLEKALAADPDGLDQVFGSASTTTPSGLFGAFDKLVSSWTDNASGQIQRRQNTVSTQQKALTAQQTRLDARYDSLYKRYLAQFTQLQTLQQNMSETTNLFTSLSTS